MWQDVVTRVMDDLDEQGWDLPALVWAVVPAGSGGFTAVPLCELDEHPVQALPMLRAPDDAVAVLSAAEGFRPADSDRATLLGLAPSEDPDRVEGRVVTVVDSSGVVSVYMRDRGSAEVVCSSPVSLADGGDAGRVPDVLARVLGVEVPERLSVAELLGRAVLSGLVFVANSDRFVWSGEQGSSVLVREALGLAGVLADGLFVSPSGGERERLSDQALVFGAVGGSRMAAVVECLSRGDAAGVASALGDVSGVCGGSWGEFWELPGACRWFARDVRGVVVDEGLWSWWGSGCRANTAGDRLMVVADAVDELRVRVGSGGFGGVGDLLGLLRGLGLGVDV